LLGCVKLKETVSILKTMKEEVHLAISLPNGIYTLQDNGLRCFLPPCFSWNVLDSNGQLIAQVSDIDFSYLKRSSDIQDLQVSLANQGLHVRGYTVPLSENDGVRQAVKFVVESLEGN
jgi:hypothetical protein